MTPAVAFLLAFLIYRPADDHAAEAGEVVARSCAEAEAWILGALQPGQAVSFGPCQPQPVTLAQRPR